MSPRPEADEQFEMTLRATGARSGNHTAGVAALVAMNAAGASLFVLPALLAADAGPVAVVACLLTAAVFVGFHVLHADVHARRPHGAGPHSIVQEMFGDLPAFLGVWLYWISGVLGAAAMALGVVAYGAVFVPVLESSVIARFFAAAALLWILTAIAAAAPGRRAAFRIAVAVLSLGGAFALAGASLTAIDSNRFQPFAPDGWSGLAVGCALLVWAFSGLTSAVAAERRDAGDGARRGAAIGFAIAVVALLLVTVAAFSVLPVDQLASTPRPLALVMEQALGPAAARAMAIAAILAGAAALNGWLTVSARAAAEAARQGIFFARMGRMHSATRGPVAALVTGGIVATVVLLASFGASTLEAFRVIVLLAAWTTLVPHLLALAAGMALTRRDPQSFTSAERSRARVVAPAVFLAMIYFAYGTGAEAGRWGFVALAAGLGAFVLLKPRRIEEEAEKPIVDPLQIEFPISFRVVTVAKTQESFPKPE